jgi:hypothetical protein
MYPEGKRILFDIKDWLYEELILKEVDFRASVKNHDWSQYENSYVAITCSTDAIIPSWAFMLVTTAVAPFTKKTVIGDLKTLENAIFQDVINQQDFSDFKDLPVIIKGCSEKPIPESAYSFLIEKLLPVSRSILFGEACSTVPLYKAKK